ncbi:unnamed protein product [Diatraea saccharalis]|uniref:Carboxylic ester hydrolase n=1 Tax=Diatraea saccharalis TaxID=40085 RepID=A0A9N9N338_9NEOP|nr:unnamed protein product [Diatraea saccharalis]
MRDISMVYYEFLRTRFVLSIVVLLLFHSATCEIDPVINTPLGLIRGYHMKTQSGRSISAFTSIPFALPPVGNLRFKAPVPVEPWSGELDGTKQVPACIQRNPYIRQKEIVGQEDCLYLNVYTPYTSNDLLEITKPLPVMMFIHGGGWMCGDSTTEMYGPEYLLDHDVVLVTTNYRLGPLGFLSTKDEHCPGNNGLKDQQEALRFIRKTIESFGGDKNSVTIFGESAGGASVHYHMLSKTSAGLFHKAISESGTAMVPWAEQSPGEAERNAYLLGKFVGCPNEDSKSLIECLRTKDSYDLINTEFQFYKWDYEPMTPFKAVVEPDLPGAFLTKHVRQINGDIYSVPWLTGLTENEGCLKSVWITTNETRFQEFMEKFNMIAPVTFYYNSAPEQEKITKIIQDYYLNDPNLEAIKQGILNIYTDCYFAYPMVEAVADVLKHGSSPVYLYELTYRATNSFSQIFGDPEGNYGVCHADDLMHLFPISFLTKPFSAKDKEVGNLIRAMWTNFAKTGNPNEPVKISTEWNMASPEFDYLDIGNELIMKKNLGSRSKLWGSLPLWYNKHVNYRHPDEL